MHLSTTPAEGGSAVWGMGNDFTGNGQVINESSRTIYVYVTDRGWKPLPPGKHTPLGSDADGWTFDPIDSEGPRDPSGDPLFYKAGNFETAAVRDTSDGHGVENNPLKSSAGLDVIYPESMCGKHPKDLPLGHNGTPDTDLPANQDRGTDFDSWYNNPANGKKNPNSPNYQAPRPPPPINGIRNVRPDGTLIRPGENRFRDDDNDGYLTAY